MIDHILHFPVDSLCLLSAVNYGDQLADVMHKTLLISEVASFAKGVSSRGSKSGRQLRCNETLESFQFDANGVTHAGEHGESTSSGEASVSSSASTRTSNPKLFDNGRRDRLTGSLTSSQKVRVIQLLESWEEPTLANKKPVSKCVCLLSCNIIRITTVCDTNDFFVFLQSKPSINAILQFRQALTLTGVSSL